MKEDLITYETAVLAKEKGFDWLVYSLFTENGKHPIKNSTAYNYNEDLVGHYSRPTQALLQKWLREVHSIHIVLTPYHGEQFEIELYKFYNNNLDAKNTLHADSFSTYEEALEDGLKESLKLIDNE